MTPADTLTASPYLVADRLTLDPGITLGARAEALASILCAAGHRLSVWGRIPCATLRDLDGVAINRAFAETADEAIEIVWQVWKAAQVGTI
jgi:hypothetical protein